jgi:hypothetical protein
MGATELQNHPGIELTDTAEFDELEISVGGCANSLESFGSTFAGQHCIGWLGSRGSVHFGHSPCPPAWRESQIDHCVGWADRCTERAAPAARRLDLYHCFGCGGIAGSNGIKGAYLDAPRTTAAALRMHRYPHREEFYRLAIANFTFEPTERLRRGKQARWLRAFLVQMRGDSTRSAKQHRPVGTLAYVHQ